MAIKYASEIIKKIEKRESIKVPKGYVTGEEFERWLIDTNSNNSKELKKD